MSLPLDGVRVIEVDGGVGTAYCAALLADLGAETVLAEDAPAKPTFRRLGDAFAEGLRRSLDRNKNRVAVDGSREWRRLLEWADIAAFDGPPNAMQRRAEAAMPPHLVEVCFSSFGMTGPHHDWNGSDLIDVAYGGGCQPNGEPGRPPLRPPAYVGDHEVGVGAAVAALLALISARRDGAGQVVEVSGVDAWATMQTAVGLLEFIFQGRVAIRAGRRFGRRYPYTMLPCKDGEVRLVAVVGREWQRALSMMGDPDWGRDPRYADRQRNQSDYADELDTVVGSWLAERTREDVLQLALKHGVPWAPVRRLDEVMAEAQLRERGFVWNDGSYAIPGFPATFSRTPLTLRRGAPQVASPEVATSVDRTVGARRAPTSAQPTSPLDGIRVIDLCWAWAGGAVGSILADFGADVIKVESNRRLDPMRMDQPLLGGDSGVEQSGLHHNVNRNKRSIAIDFTQPEGADLVRRLATKSDVLLTNLSAGTLDEHGLGYEDLASLNPRLIYLTNTGTGTRGPLASLRAYAPVITALAGVDSITGYPGERPMGLNHGIADPNAALHSALAVLAALIERGRSSAGQRVDVSQLEAMITLIGAHIVAAQIDPTSTSSQPLGNRDPLASPCGVYPSEGADKWLALACMNDAEWPALAALIGRPDWGTESAYTTAELRSAHADEIDAAIARWSGALDRFEAASRAQAAGVTAAPLLDTADRFGDEHLWAREDFVGVEHPVVGSEFVYGLPWKLSRTPGKVLRAAPLLGQDTREVLTSILGLHEAEIDELSERGVLR